MAFRVHWEGLKGRKLTSLNPQPRLVPPSISKQDAADSMIVVGSKEIVPGLPEIVRKLTQPVYEIFDFFTPTAQFIDTELAEFRRSRVDR